MAITLIHTFTAANTLGWTLSTLGRMWEGGGKRVRGVSMLNTVRISICHHTFTAVHAMLTLMHTFMAVHTPIWTLSTLGRMWEGGRRRDWGLIMLNMLRIIIMHHTSIAVIIITLMHTLTAVHTPIGTHHILGRVWEGGRKRGRGVSMLRAVRIITPDHTFTAVISMLTLNTKPRSPTDDETMVVVTTTIEENFSTTQTAAGHSQTRGGLRRRGRFHNGNGKRARQRVMWWVQWRG
jgi:hypothetical protein